LTARTRLLLACVLAAGVITGWALLALDARATYGARTTADEPQYLLSAISLAEDLDLDIRDELAEERWRDFHAAPLPEQTKPLPDGRRMSPHDPLLPVVLALPVAVGGWAGAKAMLALLAGALAAALVWVAHRRFGVRLAVAVPVVLAGTCSAPLTAYGTQLYPELPAALVTTVGVAALTGALRRRGLIVLALAVVALPWLSVKYAPVAAALVAVAAVQLWRRGARRELVLLGGGLAVAGVTYFVAHRLLYGGWTVYAAGDHFVGGELDVVGTDPDYVERGRRLLGLLVDRNFGLVAWAPVFLLALPAVGALVRRRPPGTAALLVPFAAGWCNATFVALTMHGWWWPGRQVVVVLPCLVLALCWWAEQVRWARVAAVVAGVIGAFTWAWLVTEVLRLDLRLVIDFAETNAPWHRWLRPALPELSSPTAADWARDAGWAAVAGALLALGAASVSSRVPHEVPAPAPPATDRTQPTSGQHQEERDETPIPATRRRGGDELAARAVRSGVR
jgi:hypothetical protein